MVTSGLAVPLMPHLHIGARSEANGKGKHDHASVNCARGCSGASQRNARVQMDSAFTNVLTSNEHDCVNPVSDICYSKWYCNSYG